jgi:hypothetical protein
MSTMTARLRKLLETDHVGTTTLIELSSPLAPITYANYDSGMRHFATFCQEESIHPLQAITQSIVRYTASLIYMAPSPQPHCSSRTILGNQQVLPRPQTADYCRRRTPSGRTPRNRNAARTTTHRGLPLAVTSPPSLRSIRRRGPDPRTPNVDATIPTPHR